ncbi:MAG: hypothetical protein R2864_06200 [Syntrophotaleaceae bacterium]
MLLLGTMGARIWGRKNGELAPLVFRAARWRPPPRFAYRQCQVKSALLL